MAQSKQSAVHPDPEATGSYISTLKLLSSKSRTDAQKNRLIERLRKCTDMELAKIGVNRSGIERLVYGGELV